MPDAEPQGLYQKIEEGYYSFCEKLQKGGFPIYDLFINPLESKGIPSLPILVVLLLLIMGGGIFLLYSNQPVGLKVTVLSPDGSAVDGANVILTGDGISKELSTENGIAEFTKLQKGKKVSITVKKEGFADSFREITIGSSSSLSFELSPPAGIDVEIQTRDFDGNALANVLLSYSYDDKDKGAVSDSTSSDSSGKATISLPNGAQVSIDAAKSGYEKKSASFAVKKGMQPKRIVLKKIADSPGSEQPTPEYSDFTVILKGGSTKEADLTIYDAATQDVLKETRTEFGTVSLKDEFKIGQTVKVVAEAEGYEKASKTKSLGAKTTVTLELPIKSTTPTPTGNASQVKIRVIDEKNATLSANIRLWEILEEGNFTLVNEVKSGSELIYGVSRFKAYYATTYKEGYLPARTLSFTGGATKTIVLVKATDKNSGNLTIGTIDEDGKKLIQVSLAFFDDHNYQMPPFEIRTDGVKGRVTLRNFPQGGIDIVASKTNMLGRASVTVDDSTDANVTLLSPRGTLQIAAYDLDKNPISQFEAKAYGIDNSASVVTSCSTTAGSCSLTLRADKQFKITVSSPNYESAEYRNWKVIANAVTNYNASLAHIGTADVSRIPSYSILDLDHKPVATLVSDSYYLLVFDVYAKNNTDRNGVFVSLKGNDGRQIAYIVNYSYEGLVPAFVNGSESLASLETCVPTYSSSSTGAPFLAWINAEYSFKGSSQVEYLIYVVPDVSTDKLVVNYRSYAAISGSYYRDPTDPVLGFSYSTANKSWCQALTKNATVSLRACGTFGEQCCSNRAVQDGGACDLNYQCLRGEGDDLGVCGYPTSCGSGIYFCTGNQVCCSSPGFKRCAENANACPAQNTKQCNFQCNLKDEYCDSSSLASGGICEKITSICGKEGQICCSGQAQQCNAGLTCENNQCKLCGSLDQACCPFATNPQNACSGDLQCVISGSATKCQNPQLCGAHELECSDASVCCNDAAKRGQCVPYPQCTTPLACSNCAFDQYCDTTDLNNPKCAECSANPGACYFGKGGLCDFTNETHRCEQGACELKGANGFGICTVCGQEGQKCCDTDPQCTQENTQCDSESLTCKFGTSECNNEMCGKLSFEQYQCPIGATDNTFCKVEKANNNFVVHSLKECGASCIETDLKINFEITEIANKLPGELTFSFENTDKLRARTIFLGNKMVTVSDYTKPVTFHIDDPSQLKGALSATPYGEADSIKITATYKHATNTTAITMKAAISIVKNTPIDVSEYPDIGGTGSLTLNNTQLPGAGSILQVSAKSITFQVDPIFPADAIPLSASGMASCGTWDIHFGTVTSPNLYDACFDYQSQIGGSALRYWPSKNPSCILKPTVNNVPVADLIMTVRCLSSGQSKTVPIKIIKNALSINGIDVSVVNYKTHPSGLKLEPQSYYGYNGESYSKDRLVYVLNNRVKAQGFDVSDIYYAGRYSQERSGSYKFGSDKSLIMQQSETAGLFSWDTGDANAVPVRIYQNPQERLNSLPTAAFVLTSDKESENSLTRIVEKMAVQKPNYKTNRAQAVLESFRDLAKTVAQSTLFRRSFTGLSKIYCNVDNPSLEQIINYDTCRSSEAEWAVVTPIKSTLQANCKFCLDTYAHTYSQGKADSELTATDIDKCDIRCRPDDAQGTCRTLTGSEYCARIATGENYTDPNGLARSCNATEGSCAYPCSAASESTEGDYCGNPRDCSNCGPDGLTGATEVIDGYDYQLPDNIKEIDISKTINAYETKSPYKYFADPDSNPYAFSIIFQASADEIFNKLPNYELDYRVDTGNLPAACKVRQGIYLLQTSTSNGGDFYSDNGGVFAILPLQVTENYPQHMGQGQDYCGTVSACNLFDPYDVETKIPSMKKWFNQTKYQHRCLAWEWPIVPKDVIDRPYGGAIQTYSFKDHCTSNEWTTPDFYFKDNDQSNPSMLESTHLIYYFKEKGIGDSACVGCNDNWYNNGFASFPPYSIANYPDVFGSSSEQISGSKLDADSCETHTVSNAYTSMDIEMCGEDVKC